MYRQLRKSVFDSNYQLVPASEGKVGLCLENPSQDYYTSIYKYSEDQYKEFQIKKSIKGMTDVVSDWLVFDFDSKDNLPAAQKDAVTICHRLMDNGVHEQALRIAYSGSKGFHVEVRLNQDLKVDEFKAITRSLAGDLPTFDKLICDHARPFRILGSLNPKTGLFKIPLSLAQLQEESIENIKKIASTQDIFSGEPWKWDTIDLPKQLSDLKVVPIESPKLKVVDSTDIDWSKRPKDMPNCRYAIYNGLFKAGERNAALMTIVSYFKNRGDNSSVAYHRGLGVIENQANRNNCDEVDKKVFHDTVVNVIYSDSWKGGQYTCREEGSWLASYCKSLGDHKCNHKDDENCFVEIDDFAARFSDFAVNIDKNRLKFGIDAIDNRVMVTTSMLVGLLGAPSAGKTTLLLNFLEQTNRDKIDSVFFSMDMSLPLVYLRLIQKNFGYSKDQVFDMFLNNRQKASEVIETIKEKYKYTKFSFKTGMDVDKMRTGVKEHEEKIGRKVKLVGIDYLECINGPYSDATANSGLIANQLKDMANDLEVCNMLLLQTQKASGDPSEPLLSMRNVKGSSVVEQAASVIMSLSRPGFSPVRPEDDKFATISTVKDRMGSLTSIDLGWDGLKGAFYNLPDEDRQLLSDVKNRKKEEKAAKAEW